MEYIVEYTEEQAWVDLGNIRMPFMRTGSREICSPAPLHTDVDFVVLDINGKSNFGGNGFNLTCEPENYGFSAPFTTYRRGEVNLIVVNTWEQFRAWKAATAAAKQMNLTDKQSRIALFQGVLYGNW